MREYLKAMRAEKGLSMQDVADRLEISKQYYQLIESGERQQNMDITLAVKIAGVMEIPVERIIAEEQSRKERGNDT